MRYFKYFLLLIMLIPMSVFAEDICDNNEIIIKDLEYINKNGLTEIINDAELTNNKIDIDVKMYEVGDSITYQFTVVNESDNDYAIDTRSLIDPNNHIDYKLDSEDHNNKIKSATEKDFILTATYKNEIGRESFKAGKYDGSVDISLLITDPALINPMTGNFFYYILILILIICVVFGIKYKKNTITSFGIIGLLIIPITTYAICTINLDIDFNIEVGYVKPNPCTYNGNLVQGAEYINGQYTYRYKQHMTDTSWADMSEDGWGVILTDKDSTRPVTSTLCTSINNKPIVSTQAMYYNSNATSIDISSLDTSNVVYMNIMFSNTNISSYDLSNFDTTNVLSMSQLFSNNPNLESVDISNWYLNCFPYGIFLDDPNLVNVKAKNWSIPESFTHGFFRSMSGVNIETIDVTGWDLSRTKYIYGLFGGTLGNGEARGGRLTSIIGLDTWNTSNIVDMNSMFQNLTAIEELDLGNFDTSNVTNMNSMFYGDNKLKSLDLSNFDTSVVSNISYMFCDCSELETLNISGFDFTALGYNTSNFSGVFDQTTKLETVIIDDCTFNYVLSGLLGGASSLKTISAKRIHVPVNFNTVFAYMGCNGVVETIDVTDWDLSITENLYGLFQGCSKLNNIIGLDTWDVSGIDVLSRAFGSCTSLTELDLSSWDTSSLTSMGEMFYACTGLTKLVLDNWNLGVNCNNAMVGCISLKELSLKNCKIPNSYSFVFFRNLTGLGALPMLESVDVTGWDLSNGPDMRGLFYPNSLGLIPIKEIVGLDTWDTSNMHYFSSMFCNLSEIEELDLSNFTFADGVDVDSMFNRLPKLKVVDLSGADLSKIASGTMFYGNTPSLETIYVRSEADAEILYNNSHYHIPATTNIVVKN